MADSSFLNIRSEYFDRSDYLGFWRQCYRKFGWRALDKQFRKSVRRPFSRKLLSRFAPGGVGIEVGVGEQTIAPTSRTILTDGFQDHASRASIAKVFCKAESIPFPDETFSFVLSEHVLEHVTDPISVLREWKRVLKKDAPLFLFLPHKERTFDKLRPRTSLAHLIEDFQLKRKTGEDKEKIQEWMDLVISKGLAPHYGSMTPQKMIETGCVHLHVWVTEDIVELLAHVGLRVVFREDLVPDRNDSFVVVAVK